MKPLLIIFLFICLFIVPKSQAFPELVRRGYANCITCHTSPSGGGLLTEYGRSLSSEVLSTWGSSDEAKFLYGAVPLPKWLLAGGDFRALQTFQYYNGSMGSKLIAPMQADLEAAVTTGQVTLAATGGIDYDGNPLSRRHYVTYHPMEELSFRVGKFMPAYGIYTEDHAIAIKRGIGKDQSTETYNVEASWVSENFDAFLTAIIGRPDNSSLGAESGVAASSSLFLGERFKVGASYYFGYRDIAQRHLAGPFAILGFTPKLSLLAELDVQWLSLANTSSLQTGFVDDVRLDYEFYKGMHVYVTQEFGKLDFNNANSYSDAYGIGAQFFPRPHLELNFSYQRQRLGGMASSFGDFFWMLFHFYV